MKRLYYISVCFLALCLTSCSKDTRQDGASDARKQPIITKAGLSLAGVAGNADIGIFVGQPVNENNVRLSYEDGVYVPKHTLYWVENQTETSTITVYAPYSPGFASGTAEFSVAADQTSAGAFEGSQLVYGQTTASPDTENISIEMAQLTCMIELVLDNRMEEYDITGVALKNVARRMSVNILDGSRTTDTQSTDRVDCYNADGVYYAVIAPQTARLEIEISMSNGSSYVKKLDASQDFREGKKYSTAGNPVIIGTKADAGVSLLTEVEE